jgi:serine phosphatase RsbU (regulator of sigma subunit)
MIKRSDGVSEADGGGELPLGMAPDVTYPDYELKLQTDDIVIFYTDGIIEAGNGTEEMYGTERLEKALSGIESAMSSSEIIDAILKDITDFTGSAEQYDEAREMYQTESLLEVVKQADSDISAQEMVDLIIKEVTEFVGDEEVSDDITIVVLRCKE